MTFRHKLAHRLALLRDRSILVAVAGLAFLWVASCEKPLSVTEPNPSVAQLVVSPKVVTLQENQMQDFTAVGFTTTGDTAEIGVTWSATGGTIDTSSNGKRHFGHYKNGSCGTFKIVASSHPGDKRDTATVTVSCPVPVPVASVTVSPPSASVPAGQTVQLTATPKDANGIPLSGRAITWLSDNTTVASVSPSGLVTGNVAGSATITASSEGQSGSASVTVTTTTVPVASVTVSPPSPSVPVGQTVQLTATPRDANGNALSGRTIIWLSDNTTVASVSPSGLVTANAAGSATITATSEGQSGTSVVTVPASPPPGCTTSTPAWLNSAFTTQTGAFTAQFDATPNGPSIDGVTGLSAGAAAGYTDLAVGVRFNVAGQIDARNGAAYAAASTVGYTAGTSYRFRLVVDISTHTYSAYVTPAGSAEVTIGTGFAFRTEQSAVTQLANWAASSDSGTHTICNFAVTSSTPPVPVVSVTVTPASANVPAGQTVQLTATPRDANGNALSGRTITWLSDNTTVATVSTSGLVTANVAGSAMITATSEGQSGSASITVTTVPVATVTVSPSPASLAVGQTLQLSATPRDGSGNPLSGRVVTWSSDNTTVATVNSSTGLVTAGALGSATITATSEGKSGTSVVTVTDVPVATVTVSPSPASVVAGQTVQLTATPKDANGNPLTGRVVTWSSSNTSVATVNGSGLVSGVVAGSATITATSEGRSGTSAITVTPVPVASVTVSPSPASVNEGRTVQLTATPKDANGNPLSGRTIAWSSSNTAVATVSPSGLVTGKVAGSATITATSEGQSGTSAITVVHVPVASVTVSPSPASVQVGQTAQLTATPKDASGNPLTGRVVTWASNNTSVATVNGSGLVSGVTAGSATITATSEGQSGSASITVTASTGGSQFGHVFIVTEENTDYVDVIGSSSMPYLNGLAQQYGLATQYYANTHPSIGNYFELSTGQIISNNDGFSTVQNVPNVVRSLLAAGKTWKSYAESIPNACYLGGDTGNYARKHNIFPLLSDVANDPVQACNNVPFTQFATDLANGTLPHFSNIVPNLCNDAHDCSLSTADTWLKNNIDPLIKSAMFQQDGLLIIVFDESGGDNTNGGGRVVWVAVSPKSKRGYQSTTLYQHQSTLRLILKGLGVNVFPGAAASAPDMSEFFTP